MPRAIIIDTDPGIDDAVAILLALAAAELAVRGLVAVAGNLKLPATERNARAVVELAGRSDIPVFAGCPRPIAGTRPDAAHIHGDEGLGALALPPPTEALQAQHGVGWLIQTLRAAAPQSVTLCALGPLTNIAVALVMAPDIAAAIAELVIMGGGSHGNITPAAEFNIHCDPQAAAIVLASGRPITLVPLDATETVIGTPERIAPIAALGGRCSAAAATLLAPSGAGRSPVAMHDACVIAYLLAPGLFRLSEAHVTVETASALTLGMTIIERRRRAPNARIVDHIDVDGLFHLLAARLANLP
ncbi:MAG TPA: nucleoside hydrolase [Stellaceae bacterium]|nr:nucleoside hydrolase [Stellaceae bacterium]